MCGLMGQNPARVIDAHLTWTEERHRPAAGEKVRKRASETLGAAAAVDRPSCRILAVVVVLKIHVRYSCCYFRL